MRNQRVWPHPLWWVLALFFSCVGWWLGHGGPLAAVAQAAVPTSTVMPLGGGGETHVYRLNVADPVTLRVTAANGAVCSVRLDLGEAEHLSVHLAEATQP